MLDRHTRFTMLNRLRNDLIAIRESMYNDLQERYNKKSAELAAHETVLVMDMNMRHEEEVQAERKANGEIMNEVYKLRSIMDSYSTTNVNLSVGHSALLHLVASLAADESLDIAAALEVGHITVKDFEQYTTLELVRDMKNCIEFVTSEMKHALTVNLAEIDKRYEQERHVIACDVNDALSEYARGIAVQMDESLLCIANAKAAKMDLGIEFDA